MLSHCNGMTINLESTEVYALVHVVETTPARKSRVKNKGMIVILDLEQA